MITLRLFRGPVPAEPSRPTGADPSVEIALFLKLMNFRRNKKPAQRIPHRGPHNRDAVTGRLVAHRDGYGFVIPEQPVPGAEGDIFIAPHAMGSAMHGDRVSV